MMNDNQMISLRKSHNESQNNYKTRISAGAPAVNTEEANPGSSSQSKHVYDAYLITNTGNGAPVESAGHFTRNSVTQNNSARVK